MTPLSFVVRSHQLRGLLEPFDRAELGGSDFRPPAHPSAANQSQPSKGLGRSATSDGDDGDEDGPAGEGKLAGARWLAGEWVVDKPLWRAWQADWRRQTSSPGLISSGGGSGRGGVDARRSGRSSRASSAGGGNGLPSTRPSASSSTSAARSSTSTSTTGQQQRPRIILYLHGGAYYAFSASTHRNLTARLSASTESRVFALNYRLSPETRFPGPLHDAVLAYLRLREVEGVNRPGGPELLLAGDSAGGGLCLGLLLYLRDNSWPPPPAFPPLLCQSLMALRSLLTCLRRP